MKPASSKSEKFDLRRTQGVCPGASIRLFHRRHRLPQVKQLEGFDTTEINGARAAHGDNARQHHRQIIGI